jgi:AcrR family transcriptional regulator
MEQPPQPTSARRPGGRTARTRADVLRAVSDILLQDGYDALSIDAVAARSGVHRTTVYRRWRDSGGLLADALHAGREHPWQPPDTGSLAGDLVAVNREVVAALIDRPSLTQALIAASFRSPAAAGALRDFLNDRYARAAVVVHRAIARGEAAAGTDPRAVLVAATAPLFHELALIRDPRATGIAERYALLAAAAVGRRPR